LNRWGKKKVSRWDITFEEYRPLLSSIIILRFQNHGVIVEIFIANHSSTGRPFKKCEFIDYQIGLNERIIRGQDRHVKRRVTRLRFTTETAKALSPSVKQLGAFKYSGLFRA
jgi:hypothetical protein